MQKPQHKLPHPRQKQVFWFDLGRLIFPELISRPRTMQIRMIAISIGLAAILIGSMIGFIRQANNPANILMIQAREAR
jgi:hypothetical protein